MRRISETERNEREISRGGGRTRLNERLEGAAKEEVTWQEMVKMRKEKRETRKNGRERSAESLEKNRLRDLLTFPLNMERDLIPLFFTYRFRISPSQRI